MVGGIGEILPLLLLQGQMRQLGIALDKFGILSHRLSERLLCLGKAVLLDLRTPQLQPGKSITGIFGQRLLEVVASRSPLSLFLLIKSFTEVLLGFAGRSQR